ncbi:MAG TPA: excinuclease ABC subunit UvrC [Clostridiales bacterium]|nr:excinuclease ABC subunit UvrC [Clostridiales bacterium]
MESNQERLERLRLKAASLPFSPGIYIMKDIKSAVIYIGKSKVLRSRVSQYFAERADQSPKTRRMVSGVNDFEYILVDSEMEALTLENSLIKLHKPRYNIRLKDDKNYPYIRVTQNSDYPSMTVTRRRQDDGAIYYGPYSGINIAYDIMRTAQRVFHVACCKLEFPRDIGKTRPCLYSQLGRCMAPCTGKITSEEYKETFKDIATFLRGGYKDVVSDLNARMEAAADDLRFEAAAVYRDRISALTKIDEKQKVVGAGDLDQDVIGFYSDDSCSCLSIMNVRSGKVVDNTNFIFSAEQIADANSLTSFITDYYLKREYIPRELLLGIDLNEGVGEGEDNESLLSEFLNTQAERRVYIKHPERGVNKALVAMVAENAKQAAAEYVMQAERDSEVLIKLARMLALEVIPERIEAFDISNIGSEHVTAGMIVAIDGRLEKSEYRYYRISGGKLENPDDYLSMRQAIGRRLKNLENLPDLILLDGGRGHVSTVRELLEELNVDIPVFGMVKDDFHKTRALTTDKEEISIAREQSVFQFIYKLQEEVHRFTVSRMNDAKRKSVKKSSLTAISGIGPAKARNLLSHFGSISKLKAANVEEIAAVKGISRKNAEAISAYYSGADKTVSTEEQITEEK